MMTRMDTRPRLPFPRPGVLDPAPMLARLQAAAPVTAVGTAVGDPAWLVTGYAEARALFADPRLGRSHPDPDRAARFSRGRVVRRADGRRARPSRQTMPGCAACSPRRSPPAGCGR